MSLWAEMDDYGDDSLQQREDISEASPYSIGVKHSAL